MKMPQSQRGRVCSPGTPLANNINRRVFRYHSKKLAGFLGVTVNFSA